MLYRPQISPISYYRQCTAGIKDNCNPALPGPAADSALTPLHLPRKLQFALSQASGAFPSAGESHCPWNEFLDEPQPSQRPAAAPRQPAQFYGQGHSNHAAPLALPSAVDRLATVASQRGAAPAHPRFSPPSHSSALLHAKLSISPYEAGSHRAPLAAAAAPSAPGGLRDAPAGEDPWGFDQFLEASSYQCRQPWSAAAGFASHDHSSVGLGAAALARHPPGVAEPGGARWPAEARITAGNPPAQRRPAHLACADALQGCGSSTLSNGDDADEAAWPPAAAAAAPGPRQATFCAASAPQNPANPANGFGVDWGQFDAMAGPALQPARTAAGPKVQAWGVTEAKPAAAAVRQASTAAAIDWSEFDHFDVPVAFRPPKQPLAPPTLPRAASVLPAGMGNAGPSGNVHAVSALLANVNGSAAAPLAANWPSARPATATPPAAALRQAKLTKVQHPREKAAPAEVGASKPAKRRKVDDSASAAAAGAEAAPRGEALKAEASTNEAARCVAMS